MENLYLLAEKMPAPARQDFIEALKAECNNTYDPQIVDRLSKNIDKINWDEYLSIHPDVAQARFNPVVHYIYHGWKENRRLPLLHEPKPDPGQKRVLSCKQLRSGLVYEHGALYPCCAVNCGKKPFLAKVAEDGTFDIEKVAAARRQIERDLNTPGASTACSGCPLLEELPECQPDDEDTYYICKGFNIGESHHCNFRCIYCVFNQHKLCNEPRRVTMIPILSFLLKNNLLAQDAYVSVAGGEPLLMPDFDQALMMLTDRAERAITVNTNLSVWSETLAQKLNNGNILIRCSLDSGTPETFAKIKGRDLFWRVVENASRYARINPQQVILKYICMKENCNDTDLLGLLNILNITGARLLIDFDYYTPPDKDILRFAARLKALASLSGITADVRYDAEFNWPRPIHLRKKLDAYELLYLNRFFRLSGKKLMNSPSYKSDCSGPRGYVDILYQDGQKGLFLQGWAWDHRLGAPKSIRVYAGRQIVFTGAATQIRLDIEAGVKAGFIFRQKQNPVLKHILAQGCELETYVTFDGLKWEKLPVDPGARTRKPESEF